MAIEPTQYSNVALFLGRLQGLPVRRQNLMFAYLTEALEAVVAEARAAGVYDEGVADLRASSVTLKCTPEEVAADPATGAVTTLAQVRDAELAEAPPGIIPSTSKHFANNHQYGYTSPPASNEPFCRSIPLHRRVSTPARIYALHGWVGVSPAAVLLIH